MMKILLNIIKFFRVPIGAIICAFLYLYVCNALIIAYSPEGDDDMHAWVFLAFPTGIILGAATAYSMTIRDGRRNLMAGGICILVSVILGWIHFDIFIGTVSQSNIAFTGPGLLWSFLLFCRGISLIDHDKKLQQELKATQITGENHDAC